MEEPEKAEKGSDDQPAATAAISVSVEEGSSGAATGTVGAQDTGPNSGWSDISLNSNEFVIIDETTDGMSATENGPVDSPPMIISKIMVDPVSEVVTTDAPPAEIQAPPAETQATPTDTQATPIETQATPAETQATPAETQATPTETQATPAETQATPSAPSEHPEPQQDQAATDTAGTGTVEPVATGNVEDSIYEVEKILDKRTAENGALQYFIKWVGYDESENMWINALDVNCPALIRKFERGLLTGGKRGGKSTGEPAIKRRLVLGASSSANSSPAKESTPSSPAASKVQTPVQPDTPIAAVDTAPAATTGVRKFKGGRRGRPQCRRSSDEEFVADDTMSSSSNDESNGDGGRQNRKSGGNQPPHQRVLPIILRRRVRTPEPEDSRTAHTLVVDKVIAVYKFHSDIYYLFSMRDSKETAFLHSASAAKKYPYLVLDYLESIVQFTN